MEVRDKYAGKRAKCPVCGKIVAIPGKPEPAYDVILSYSAEDKPTADAACATLEARGIRCWIAPRDILPGQEWGEAIIDAISECGLMVLIFSSHSNESPQVRREAERAVSKGKPIIPLRIEDVTPCKTMEYFLSTPHWLDALTPPLEQHLRHLAETVQILLSRSAPPTAVATPAMAEGRQTKAVVAPVGEPADRAQPAPEVAKGEVCERCGKRKPSNCWICPHCGAVDWTNIVVTLAIGAGLVVAAFYGAPAIEPGMWHGIVKWGGYIAGLLFFVVGLGELLKVLARRRKP